MDDLDALTRAREWLDVFRPLPPETAAELRTRYEVRLTHHSTAIEGNTLTLSETQVVLETGVTVAGKSLREHLEVVGHRDALNYVLRLAEVQTPIGEREIRDIHGLVMQGQGVTHAGAYRTINVMAAGTGHAYPGHLHVRELMDEYTAWLGAPSERHPALRAAEAHLRFVTIHPFADGNGRLGRLLMNLLLVRTGYPIAVIPVQRRAEYIDALSAAQSGANAARHNQLVLDAVAASLKETLTVCVTAADMPDAAMSVLPGIRRWLEAKEG